MRYFFRFTYLFLVSSLVLVACSKDDDSPIIDDDDGNSNGPYQYGYFVLNEGTFGNADASVTFIGDNGVVHPDIFQTVTGNPLGDLAQSMAFEGDNAYIVVNGSNKIEVVNRFTFESEATLSSSLENPRYIAFANGKGFVSNWGDPSSSSDDFIAVINLETFEVEQTISVAEGPEKMVLSNEKLFVAHKGGWSFGNTLSVINVTNLTLETTIEVLDTPDSIQAYGNELYVLCSGIPSWMGDQATGGGLLFIDATNYTVVESYPYAATIDPMNLTRSGETLYFNIDNQVYRKSLSSPSEPSAVFTVSDYGATGIYGLSVRGNQLYISDPKDYNSQGEVYIFTPTGELLHKHGVGIVPNGVYFH